MSDDALTILAVDDEPGILDVYESVLCAPSPSEIPRSSRSSTPPAGQAALSASLLKAESGERAVEIASELYRDGGHIAACFVDMRMPGGIDGLETIQRLRALDDRILATFVTAYQDRSLFDIGAAFGDEHQDDWDYLNKPFSMPEILQKAINMCTDWRRRRQNETLLDGLREANERLARRTAELEKARLTLVQTEKMALVGRMAAGMAHELNNPLTSVVGYCYMALRARDLNTQRAQIERVAEQASRAGKIIKNMLIFSRGGHSEFEHLCVNEVLEKSIGLREIELDSAVITVEKDMDPALPRTMIDSNKLQQVFVNLLTNAEHAMADTGGTLRVATRAVGGAIEASVTDEGPGIPPDVLPSIFEPFFTTKPLGQGTGLGLAICYGIVAEHGGVIGVENVPPRGARFTVSLPIRVPEEAAPAGVTPGMADTQPTRPITESSGEARTGMRILVLDDEPVILDLLHSALREAGHRVVTLTDGHLALEAASREAFDLYLTDIRMPRMDGIEFSRRLVAQNPDADGRVLFISGSPGDAHGPESRIPEGARCIPKPFDIPELLREIDSYQRIGPQIVSPA